MTDTEPSTAAVTVLVEPDDDVAVMQRALTGPGLEQGRLTLHPTAVTQGLSDLADDLLTAMGKRDGSNADTKQVGRDWRQVAAWVHGYRIAQLVVLRAHLLSRTALLAGCGVARVDTLADLLAFWQQPES